MSLLQHLFNGFCILHHFFHLFRGIRVRWLRLYDILFLRVFFLYELNGFHQVGISMQNNLLGR